MLKKISVTDVIQGMYLHELCGSWMDHPFWKAGFTLNDQADLDSLRSSAVTEVWIDTKKGLDLPEQIISEDHDVAQAQAENLLLSVVGQPIKAVEMADEVQRALLLRERSKLAVISMFSAVRIGQNLDMTGADELVENLAESIERHPSALLSLVRFKKIDEYIYTHAVAVSALMVGLARQLALDDDTVHKAGLAGLMHDIGNVMIDDAILNKPGRLTDEEFAKVRLHTLYGAKILLASDGAVSRQVYEVCLHHHEKYDGTGYSKRLRGNEISLLTRMATVCDVYDAITSDRPYKKGLNPAEALQHMAQWSGHFDPEIFQAFVRIMGVYPVGSLVRLTSGRLAVVIEKNEQFLLKPKVKVFFSSKSKVPIEQEVLDLAQASCLEGIVARERIEDWGFRNLDDLWL